MLSKAELKENLSKSVSEVIFNKSDGTVRIMNCTLMAKYLPEQVAEKTNNRKENDGVIAVWDLDNEGWRSFRIESLTQVKYIGEKYAASA